jgi:serine protease Do
MGLSLSKMRWERYEPWLALGVLAACTLLLGSSVCTSPVSFAQLIRQAVPSVVTVLVRGKPEDAAQRAVKRAIAARDDLLLGIGKTTSEQHGAGLGSGFIISADGLIVTNRHVISGAGRVLVRLAKGRELDARVMGTDAPTDIALLKVDATNLPALHLGSSKDVAVGDPVVAIGNPFGVGQSATAGIISGRGRAIPGDPYIDFLQTDAAINHGNSGGPLLSTDGAVVGVTSIALCPNGGSIGLGFAIPAETVADVVRDLRVHGRVERGYLGISGQPLTPDLARVLGVNSSGGELITAVDPLGPASQMLFIGDVLTKIGPTTITAPVLRRIVAHLRPGSMVELTLVRNRTQRSIYLTVDRYPELPAEPSRTPQGDTWVAALGLGVARVSPEIRQELKAEDESGGFIVTQLRPTGAGALAGLQVGDLITHVGTKQLEEVAQLANLRRPSGSFPLLVRIVRDGTPQFIVINGTATP